MGLGKLGAPLAAILAERGHHIVGVDASPDVVDLLNDGRTPIQEPGLADLIARNRSRLQATTDTAVAIADTDVSFIVVPTPSTASGAFSAHSVIDAITSVGRALRNKPGHHVVAVTSTIMPLSTELELKPALEAASGRIVGHDVGLCYNPEFIALGSVIYDMMHPDLVLIGESDARAGDVLEAVHRTVVAESTQIRRMSWINAEIAKIAVNTFVTTKISYANRLAELCERVPGGDVDVVTGAIGIDRRIGHRYLRGAVGYGGPCFPRDNAALAAAAAQVGAHADLAVATDTINRRQVERVAEIVHRRAVPGQHRVAVLGLSYKPDTPVVEESQGVMLANRLAADGFSTTVFDPAALQGAAAALQAPVSLARSLADCLNRSDVVVVMVPWPAFHELPALVRAMRRRPSVILDCWRLLDPAELDGLAEVVHLGKAPANEQALFTRTEHHVGSLRDPTRRSSMASPRSFISGKRLRPPR